MTQRISILIGTVASALLIVVALFVAAPQWQSTAAQAQSDTAAGVRQVTVVGQGEVKGAPDTAHVQIGVETEAKTASEALEENNVKATQIISQLKELAVEEKDIQTSNFSIHAKYDEKGRKVTGYQVNNTVGVTIRNLDQAGTLLDEVVKVGANNIYGIQFSVDDPTTLLEEARTKAMENARTKASQLAQSAEASLGDALYITENIGSQPPSPRPMMARGLGEQEMNDASVPMQPGEQTFSLHVQVTYELR